jgi:hypothetical protein
MSRALRNNDRRSFPSAVWAGAGRVRLLQPHLPPIWHDRPQATWGHPWDTGPPRFKLTWPRRAIHYLRTGKALRSVGNRVEREVMVPCYGMVPV